MCVKEINENKYKIYILGMKEIMIIKLKEKFKRSPN